MKRVILMPDARKTLKRLPRPTAERILDKIELYAGEPQALAANTSSGSRATRAFGCGSAIGGFSSKKTPRR